jgi:hypothetical protein
MDCTTGLFLEKSGIYPKTKTIKNCFRVQFFFFIKWILPKNNKNMDFLLRTTGLFLDKVGFTAKQKQQKTA